MISENKVIEKLKIYESKLLDLSKRNNLINFKDTKSSTLEIIAPNIEEVFEKIFLHNFSYRVFNNFNKKNKKENSEYKVEIIDAQNNDNNALVNLTSLSKVVTTSVFEHEDEKEKYYQLYKDKINKSEILLFNYYFDANKTSVILNNLRLKSKTIMQEKGINSLFIAFGFLKWVDNPNSTISCCKSPIILIPISIKRENNKFTIDKFDDPILNKNLYFLLKNKFGITIPQYNNQILSEYFNELKKSVPINYEICQEAKISLFNYNKITMYQDLKNHIDIFANNKNISRLFGEKNSDFSGSFTKEEIQEIDNKKNSFLVQHNILDADFSQTQAIEMAKTGKSFIIQGPPGTGKSQTITNIIGELLFLNKKILFLSEKKSALEIIYSNLKKTKLQNLCLELHSYKSNKKDFIENIYKTISDKQRSTIEKENISNKNILKKIVNKIDDYQEKLHTFCPPTNKTLYQLIHSAIYFNSLINIKNKYNDLASMIINQEISHDDFLQLLSQYVKYEKLTKYNIDNFPWYEVLITNFSTLYVNNFKDLLKDYEKKIQKILDLLKSDDPSKIDFLDNNLPKFVNEYLKVSKVDSFKIFKSLVDTVEEIEKIKEKNHELKSKLSCNYDDRIYQENVQQIFDNYAKRSWLSRTFSLKFKKLNKKIFFYKNNTNKNDYSENVNDLIIILQIKENKDQIKNLICLSNLKEDFNFNDIDENFKINMSKLLNISLIDVDLMRFYYDYIEAQTKISVYFENSIINLTFAEKLNFVKKIASVLKNDDVTYLINLMEYKKILIQINKSNIKEFIKKLIELKIPTSKFIQYYEAIYYKYWADFYLNEFKLFNYTRELHNSDIDKFITLDKNQIETNQKFILDKFSNNYNDFYSKQIIFQEYKKKSHKKEIRAILNLIGDYIQKVKPVFLMSPLSVSNFLPIDFNFDVVIFDEASQIFPEDTFGAICRSKQMIVVGDPKQMPPTNFFLAKDDDEENDEEIAVYESILDLCSTVFPIKKLLVHYRSRSENLINFSNKNFYDGELITFPSIYENKEDFGIEFIFVSNGVLDANTTNIREAEKIIALIFEHFQKHPERSLGVITLNIKQRDLIEKLLEKERIKNKSFENFFDENIKEPFFIKNLENVQGDERDTIFLSICYAKNSIGKFYNRFGPINSVGGEKRLNVAITRAKFNVKVVSSIHYTDIDLTKISHLGPRLLRDYLDYAENGTFDNINQNIIVNNDKKFDSVFEEEVYNFLVAKGFSVDTQVGCCNYRIDLVLKKPDSSNYVLAIECDGASYHSSKSARDRDRYRQMILEGMQ